MSAPKSSGSQPSAPKNSGSQPSAPLSTPGAASKQVTTPTADRSASSMSWSTIPGLGSAVKPLCSTPLSVVTDSSLPPTLSATIPEGSVPPSFASALRTLPRAPPKTAGDTPTDWQRFLDKRSEAPTGATAGPSSVSKSASQPLEGLGGASHSFSGTAAASANASTSPVKWTQTEAYHKSAAPPGLTQNALQSSRTAPLPQTGFQSFIHSSSERTPTEKDDSTSGAYTDITCSEPSTNLSEHYLRQHPELAELNAPVWMELANPRSLRFALKDPNAEWEETFPSALKILTDLNPTQYLMPFGTRVVNIKTDYAGNIAASLRANKYAAIEKVTDRIMAIYKARVDSSEKVIFLFSVNGSKKFCGMAEMSGEWEDTAPIKDWKDNPDSAKAHGTIPVTWIYAKDVSYAHFNHIRQAHNGHPVGNMWNGMNFPSETGREVIERYVATPSTSSILGYPRNYSENYGITNGREIERNSDARSSSSYRGRGNFALRGVPRGGRGVARGGLGIPVWRHHSSEASGSVRDQSEDDPTPTAANIGGRFSTDPNSIPAYGFSNDGKFQSPTFSMEDLKNAPVAGNATLLPGEPVSFVMGPDGRLAAVPASADKRLPPAQSASSDKSSIFGGGQAQSTRLPLVDSSSNRGDMGPGGRGGHHAAVSGPSQDTRPSSWLQAAEAARAAPPRGVGRGQSLSAAMLRQASIHDSQQQANIPNPYPSAPGQTFWDYHSQQMASMGFQTDAPFHAGFSVSHGNRNHQDNGNDYDELPTPTHRPPQRSPRYGDDDEGIPDSEFDVTPTYREVPGWQSDLIQGMGHLQLKALFFTLAAEQHILEHLSMAPRLTTQDLEANRWRMRRVVELKREVADELYFIGHTIFNHPLDSDDFNPYEHAGRPVPMPGGYAQQRMISPLRDHNGHRLSSASETSMSRSPPFPFGEPFHVKPFRASQEGIAAHQREHHNAQVLAQQQQQQQQYQHPHHRHRHVPHMNGVQAHQKHLSRQSTASMTQGGVQLN